MKINIDFDEFCRERNCRGRKELDLFDEKDKSKLADIICVMSCPYTSQDYFLWVTRKYGNLNLEFPKPEKDKHAYAYMEELRIDLEFISEQDSG